MLARHPQTPIGDGQAYFKILEAGRVSITRYHEFPHWNPYECGGYPLWDNPQGWAGAPLTWFSFVVGTTRTIELWIIAHVAAAFVGMWLFARHELELGRLAAFVASAAWAFSGFHQHHYSGGHFTFVSFVYFPLALLLWRRAETSTRAAVGLGLLCAWMFYEGAVYPLPHLIVLLAAETLTRAWPPKRLAHVAKAGAIVGLVAFTVAASRLLPVLDQLRQHRRAMPLDVDAMQWETLKDIFLARAHERQVLGQQYVWTEFGTYVGPIVLALAVIGVVVAGTRRAWLIALLIFSVLLMLGHVSTNAPWSILHAHVPPFNQMRVPSRFRAEVSMLLAAFAGIAVEQLCGVARRVIASDAWIDAVRTAIVCVALVGVGDIISVGQTVIEPFFSGAPAAPIVAPSQRLFYGGTDSAAFIDQPRQNRGRMQCYDEWGFGDGAQLWDGDVPQARAIDDGAVVEGASRTQNTFTIDVVATRPARIALNTVYDDDWKTDVGSTFNQGHQLAVDVPAGHHHLRVRCWPRTFNAGVGLSLMGMLGSAAWLLRSRRRTPLVGAPS